MSEYASAGPWFRDKIAAPYGIEAVPAQARLWNTLGHATGVESPIGAPKLELLAGHIMRRAREKGVPPEQMRDMILSGEAYARGGII